MKLAVSGKGGVGKTMLAAALSLLLARKGQRVLAVDADPDANLANALGVSLEDQRSIVPISQHKALIEERTGAKVKEYGQIFKLNPDVSDISQRFALVHHGVSLLVLGAVEQGGSGCACPENVFIRALVSDLVLFRDESLVMDMEAGVEHLGRGTARGVDMMLVVIEPGQSSIDCAQRIMRMATDVGLKRVEIIGNQIRNVEDEQFVRAAFPDQRLCGLIPFWDCIRRSDRLGKSVLDDLSSDQLAVFEALLARLNEEIAASPAREAVSPAREERS